MCLIELNKMSNDRKIKVLITGGGTGGHIFPAIAIADAIKRLRPETEFLFVGANNRMEMERVPKAGYQIVGLNVAGFQRSLSWKNLTFPFKLLSSLRKARRIVTEFQPNVVIGTGGYASGPVMKAAQNMGIPTLIQEQNSYAGVTNKLLAKKAACVCVAYDHMDRFFEQNKILFTGNPVRTDIQHLEGKRAEAVAYYQLDPNLKTICITGGSLGSKTLNEAVANGFEEFKQGKVNVLWQCGKYYEAIYRESDAAQLPKVHLMAFIDRMDLFYAAADVIISRSGALSISELSLVGKPVVLVPSPNVAEDHQTKNALALVEKGAARLVSDNEAPARLLQEALLILENDALSFSLGESIRQLGRPGAADQIAREALKLAGLKH